MTAGLTLEEVRSKRERILALARDHKAGRVRVFGSVVRGDASPGSDVDFLVEFAPGASALDQVALVRELTAALGVEVEVVSEKGLGRRHLAILQEAVDL